MISRNRTRWSILADVLTAIIGLLFVLPLVFTVLMSVRPQYDPITRGNIFFGSQFTYMNYYAAWHVAPWLDHLLTSIIFAVGVLIVQFFTVTLAGYAFARMQFFGKRLLLTVILLQLMIPTGVLLVQNLATIRQLELFDTRWALMIPYWGSAFGVLLMRQTFREVPQELEEAARIDGANLIQVLWNVYIPLSIPAYIAFALVSVSSHWNEYLWPAIVTRTAEVRPLTVGLNQLYNTTDVGALYGQLMAGTLIVILPLVILFILFQRRFIESFASSGIK